MKYIGKKLHGKLCINMFEGIGTLCVMKHVTECTIGHFKLVDI